VIPVADIENALSATRLARQEVADLRRRTQATRLMVEWQRVRARKQMGQLEETIRLLNETLEELCLVNVTLPWTPARDALDDVLFPVD
jgi:hypothetical protein